MSTATRIGGRQVEVGIGIESLAAPGTAVAEAHFFKWAEASIQGVSEKDTLKSARGIRIANSDSFIKRKYGRGTLKFVATPVNMPFVLSLLLGSVATATNADASTLVFDHTFTVQNTNATPRTATITIKQGGIQVQQMTGCVVEKFSLSIQDGYAEVTVEFIGTYPGSDTVTPSYAVETNYTYVNSSIKFGVSLSAAAGNSATKIKAFTLEATNNFQTDDGFLFGSNGLVTGGLTMGPLAINGSYMLPFEDTTELAKYLGNTENRALLYMTGTTTIGTSAVDQVLIKIGPMVLTKEPLEFPIDGIAMVNQEFNVRYDATDKELQAVVTNLVANASGATYNPA